MRLWVRLRTAARRAPQGEPSQEAVEAGGKDATGTPPGRPVTPPGHPVAPVVVPRWIQLVILPLALLALWELIRAAGSIFLVLIIAGVVALILAPQVRRLEKVMPRGLAIPLVYIGCVAVLAVIGALLANAVAPQVSRFDHNLPQIVANANKEVDNVQKWLDKHGVKVHIEQQGQSALSTLQKDVLKRSGDIVSFSKDLLSGVVTVGFDLVLVLVLSIYLLVYGRQIGELVRGIMPPGDGTPEDDFPLLVQQAVSGYVRGQLLFSLIMGVSAGVALTILGLVGLFPAGKSYGVFFGGFYALMEFIPYIGPIIGPIPAVLVALFQNPISAVWLIILFVALQQLEGHVVAPQMFRISLRINPILIILALLIGYQIYGIAGALVALPVSAVIRQTVVYLRRHLVLESWGASAGLGLGLLGARGAGPPGGQGGAGPPGGPAGPGPAEQERCPECGAPADAEAGECPECGTPLAPRVGTTP